MASVKAIVQSDSRGAAPSNFRTMVRAALGRRCAANPQYSLRAFSLDLDIDHASLSQILRGKRRLTDAMIRRLGQSLSLSTDQIDAAILFEKITATPSAHPATIIEFNTLTEYAAAVASDWRHLAILELTRLDAFRPDVRWIARVLDTGVDDVTLAINRLCHLGMLRMESATQWVDTTGGLVIGVEDFARVALEHALDHFARVSNQAGVNQPALDVEHSCTTVAINAKRLPEVIDRIREFRRELAELIDRDAKRDALYRLDIHLFPIAQPQPPDTEEN